MIYSITVVNYKGDMLTIEPRFPERSGLIVKDITGLGPVKADINTTAITTSDGTVYNSARLTQRNIVFTFLPIEGVLEGDTEYSSVEDNRLKLSRFFPGKKKVQLYFQTENRFAYIEGYTESNTPTIFSKQVSQTISVICPYPYFYDASYGGISTTSFSGNEPYFEFPANPALDDRDHNDMSDDGVEFSTLSLIVEKNIPYYGDAETGLLIHMHAVGTVENVTIRNTLTGESMTIDTTKLSSLTGNPIIAADDIYINTKSGEKSIYLYRSGTYVNILNCVNRNANWFQLSIGDNVFEYSATVGRTNLQVDITAQTIFEGI